MLWRAVEVMWWWFGGEEGRRALVVVVVGGGFTAETSGGFNLGLVKIHLIKSET